MKDNEGSKADGVNCSETKGDCLSPLRGTAPLKIMREPIRKKAYHRALKRGESWAIMKKVMLVIMKSLAYDIFKPNPFLHLNKDAEKIIPIVYEDPK